MAILLKVDKVSLKEKKRFSLDSLYSDKVIYKIKSKSIFVVKYKHLQ